MRMAMLGLAAAAVSACGGGSVDPVKRGEYLVTGALNCVGCHTTPDANGTPIAEKYMGGDPNRFKLPTGETLASSNLTPDESGLKSWTDVEIKRAIREGVRKDGSPMWWQMPYWELKHLSDADADAVVAYLRSLKPVRTEIGPRPPVPNRTQPFFPVPDEAIPHTTLAKTDKSYASAVRGRYLATITCLHCHTQLAPTGADIPVLTAKIFGGNRKFNPNPPRYTTTSYSANLTPHANGMADVTPDQLRKLIKEGAPDACKPMPSGPTRTFGKMTDADALDIATYLTTIPKLDTGTVVACTP